MEPSVAWKLVAIVFLVGANAFFVGAEFALVSARRTRIREMARGGDRLAAAVERAQRDLDLSVSGCQLGITLASLALGWIGEPALADTLEGAFAGLPGVLGLIATHSAAVAIAFFLITFLHIVLGEQAPKMAAILRAERMSRWLAPPLNLFNFVMTPAIWFINGASNLSLRPFGLDSAEAHERVHSPEEIQMLLQQSLHEGVVEADEQAMIHGVFELTHTVAREVMTPRTDIVGVPADASLDGVLSVAAESGFSRFPVYEESIDDIVGVLLVKDLIPRLAGDERERVTARDVAREALFIPDSKPVDDLLAELRHRKVHMAIVVDEFGGTDGIVTLEDLVEEIVGDIFDEHDVARPELSVEADGRVVLDGGYSFDDLLREFELTGPDDTYDTVAGFVIGHLGRIPEKGERVPLDGAELEVLELHDRRVTRLALHLSPNDEEPEKNTEAASVEEATAAARSDSEGILRKEGE